MSKQWIQSNQKAETPFEKFRAFAKQIVSVPKEEIDRREAAYKKARAKAKRKGVSPEWRLVKEPKTRFCE